MVKKLKSQKAKGLAIVEAALVFPLLLLICLGAIRYGHLFLRAQEINNAARNGARIGIRPGSYNADVTDAVESLMAAAGMAQASSGYELTLPADVHALTLGQSVTVRLSVPVANVGALQVPLFTNVEPNGGNWNIVASVTMAKEGF